MQKDATSELFYQVLPCVSLVGAFPSVLFPCRSEAQHGDLATEHKMASHRSMRLSISRTPQDRIMSGTIHIFYQSRDTTTKSTNSSRGP